MPQCSKVGSAECDTCCRPQQMCKGARCAVCTQRAPGALRPRRRLQHSRSTGRSAVRVRSAVAAAVHTAVLTGGRGARGYACTPEKALCAISHSTNRPPPLSRTLTPRSERTPYHGVCYNTGARVYIRVLKRAGAAAALARTSSGEWARKFSRRAWRRPHPCRGRYYSCAARVAHAPAPAGRSRSM